MNPAVDAYLASLERWGEELSLLRNLVLQTGLVEELKWGVPTYTYKGHNVVILFCLKDQFGISFLKGVFLADEAGILVMPGENSRSGRIVKFSDMGQVAGLEDVLVAYIYEAIEVERAGLKVAAPKPEDLVLPVELAEKLEQDQQLNTAFRKLTPGRQRGYVMHIASAKQAATRVSRVEQHTSRILAGIGIDDCTCGLSKRKPRCDGSHRELVV